MSRRVHPFTKGVWDAWDRFEEEDPDISTERLMQLVADECDCDVADVAAEMSVHPSVVPSKKVRASR